MIYVQNLKLEGSFHIHLLKGESLSVLIENLSLRGGPNNMVCDITTCFEANCGVCALRKSIRSAHTLRMDFTVKEEKSLVQQFNF